MSRWLDGVLKNCGLIHGTSLQKTVTHVVSHWSPTTDAQVQS